MHSTATVDDSHVTTKGGPEIRIWDFKTMANAQYIFFLYDTFAFPPNANFVEESDHANKINHV